MSGKGGAQLLTWQDYLLAYNLLYTEDGIIAFEEKLFPQDILNAEKMLLKKESFSLLSKDAKKVIKIILNAPAELLCGTYDTMSKYKIRKFLMRKKKWKKRRVQKIFLEIKNFTKNI